MNDRFVVPQFIDSEDKILGPVTTRQFVILMITAFVEFSAFKLLSFTTFLIVGIPFFLFAAILAFVKVNGQPFHFFLLNLIQTFGKPGLRVWDKRLTDSEVRAYLAEELPKVPETFKRKTFTSVSRLAELSLVVNTGGVYKPE